MTELRFYITVTAVDHFEDVLPIQSPTEETKPNTRKANNMEIK